MDLSALMSGGGFALQLHWATLLSIATIVVATAVALRLLGMAVRGVARVALQRDKEPTREVAQKAKTLSHVVETTGRVVIFVVAGLSLLSLVWRDLTPLLASAGVATVVIGFGAQNLIKDWLAGFFILLENQYSVDDVIKVGEHSGVVEKLELRRTVLRTLDGSVVIIPNGDVRAVTNLTKEWSRVVMDVAISYDEDVDRTLEALRQVGEELAADPEVGMLVLEPPEVLGVEALGQYSVTLRMLVKTLPAKQWAVARALRARLKKMFEREGIQIPYPRQITISHGHPSMAGEEGLATLYSRRERSE